MCSQLPAPFLYSYHTTGPRVRYYYVCCRDVSYKPSKQRSQSGRQRPRQKPSRKLGAVCTSRMYVTELQSGRVQVKYISAHSNHDIGPTEDSFVSLPASTKEGITMKLSVEAPIQRIMDGNMTTSLCMHFSHTFQLHVCWGNYM